MTKLHDNQLNLIRHLIRFHYLDYENCLKALNTETTYDRIAMSYAFRPLTKNKYLSKNKEGIVSVLKKGRLLFPEEKPLISYGCKRDRIVLIAKVAMWMEKCDVIVTDKLPENQKPHFIPSACWRNIAPGLLSTTLFAGILLAYGKKYAVYDIGNGGIEWQVRAETSLFYTRYGDYETKADGMIFICDDNNRMNIAENIIRQTMWQRKTLLKSDYTERNRPVRFSNSPIKLRTQYEHVYLTTPERLRKDMIQIYKEEQLIQSIVAGAIHTYDPKEGDLEKWPLRYYVNPAFDLLKLVYFFSAVKALHELIERGDPVSDIKYAIIMHKKDLKIITMYPDVLHSERVVFYELKSDEDS